MLATCLVLVAFTACATPDEDTDAISTEALALEATDDAPLGIFGTYHGILLDAERKPIQLDQKGAAELQDKLIAGVLEMPIGPELAAKRNAIVGNHQLSVIEKIVVNDALLSWAVATDVKVAARYGATHLAIGATAIDLAHLTRDFWQPRPWLLDVLRQHLADAFIPILRAGQRGQAYLDRCNAAEVPTPPNWPSSAWVARGEFDGRPFLTSPSIRVYQYTVPGRGQCTALPRLTSDGSIDLMGIICSSDTTGKACFWDNIDAVTESRIHGPLATTAMQIRYLQNGDSLRENCTNCHRGENVYVGQPGTRLAFPRAPVWPAPVSTNPAWVNPPAFRVRGTSSCSGCHAVASLSTGAARYCGTVMRSAADLTMPSTAAPIGWGSSDPEMTAIRSACAGATF